jgi:hypothetical protein
MASGVVVASGTDVLFEPFANFTFAPWTLAGTPTIVAGRNGTGAQFAGSSAIATYTIPSLSESDTVTVGFAWRATSIAVNPNIMRLSSDAAATFHDTLVVLGTGALRFNRGTSTPLDTSAAGLITTATWYYIEVQAKLHDTAGTATVRLNGTPVIALTGIDTKNAGTKTVFDSVALVGAGSTTQLFDDLYITTGAGATFKGDITVP